LLDHDTYAFEDAQPVLALLRQKKIPVILCTSKTRVETEQVRAHMALETPFIVENGAAIFIPKDLDLGRQENMLKKETYLVKEFGTPYHILRQHWKKTKAENPFRMKGFSDMTDEEIARHTGLSSEAAHLAAQREYSEPFLFFDGPKALSTLLANVKKTGLQVTKGGRFYHLIGKNDKGKAVRFLKGLYEQRAYPGTCQTIGLGDSANDIPMLENVDVPVIIKKKEGTWETAHSLSDVVYSKKPGPAGWAEEVSRLLSLEKQK
jgi:mannosyl-3-phosphoglycerate phosphatase